ncbi:MAG: hypothetical protein N4A31_02810 [Rickettsiales bacterium]|jgi:hypothetical protein|nr:hypothetical protein [Rickettsiales bacterium]
MKRKLSFDDLADSAHPPTSPFSVGDLSPIINPSPMQSQPAPGFETPPPTQPGGALTITPTNHLLFGYHTPAHGNAPLAGIVIHGGAHSPGAIGPNAMTPQYEAQSPIQQTQLVFTDSESEGETDTTEEITDQEILDAVTIITTDTPVRDQIPNARIDGLTPLRPNEMIINPFADGDTTSDSESDSEDLNNAFILDDKADILQGEHSLFTLKELEEENS